MVIKPDAVGRLERASLVLVTAACAIGWINQHLLLSIGAPDWAVRRFTWLVWIPAICFGAPAWKRYGGFSKHPALIALALLTLVGCGWVDESERKRAMLIALSVFATLPICALIRKHNFLGTTVQVFAFATTASMLYALTLPRVGDRWGSFTDAAGKRLYNPDAIGLQAATAALLLVIAFPRGHKRRITFGAITAFLLVICAVSASRTAVLSLLAAGFVGLLMRLRRNMIHVLPVAIGVLVSIVVAVAMGRLVSTRPFYNVLVSRMLLDSEGNTSTLGRRTIIWQCAWNEFMEGDHLWYGAGTGGSDKALGQYRELLERERFPDGIWRVYAHNVVVWSGLSFGLMGLAVGTWLTFAIARQAIELERRARYSQCATYLIFLVGFGTGAVVTLEPYWVVTGSAFWAILSMPRFARRPEPVPQGFLHDSSFRTAHSRQVPTVLHQAIWKPLGNRPEY